MISIAVFTYKLSSCNRMICLRLTVFDSTNETSTTNWGDGTEMRCVSWLFLPAYHNELDGIAPPFHKCGKRDPFDGLSGQFIPVTSYEQIMMERDAS